MTMNSIIQIADNNKIIDFAKSLQKIISKDQEVMDADWLMSHNFAAIPVHDTEIGFLEDNNMVSRLLAAASLSRSDSVFVVNLFNFWDSMGIAQQKRGLKVDMESANILQLQAIPRLLSLANNTLSIADTLWFTDDLRFILFKSSNEHYVVAGPEKFITQTLDCSLPEAMDDWKKFADKWPSGYADIKSYYLKVYDHYRKCCKL